MFKAKCGAFTGYFVQNKEADLYALNDGTILAGCRIDSGLFGIEQVEQLCYYPTKEEAEARAADLNK